MDKDHLLTSLRVLQIGTPVCGKLAPSKAQTGCHDLTVAGFDKDTYNPQRVRR